MTSAVGTAPVTPPAADPAVATSTAPTGAQLWRRARAPLAVVLLLVLVLGGYAVATTGGGADLDPRSYSPGGSHALAALLRARGVGVDVVEDLPAVRSAAGARTTVLVPAPAALTKDELAALGRLPGRLVVTGAGPDELQGLGLAVQASGADVDVRAPGCLLPAAQRAGAAVTGGTAYVTSSRALACYRDGDGATLLSLPDRRTTLLGGPDLLTNDALDREGNAALALGLLGAGDRVLWLLPDPNRALTGERPSLTDLLPRAVPLAVLELGLAAVLLALARARRLGRVVPEPLPVVVRAAESVEGRGRLYRAAGARETAAEALRAGARDRLARRLGLPAEADRAALVSTLSARLGQDPARADALLYGPAPADDAALVRLAEDLDRLSPDARETPARPVPRSAGP